VKRDVRLDLSRPAIKYQEIDSCEGIDCVDGDGDCERYPEISICKRFETRSRFKIIETLEMPSISKISWNKHG
jgi:hypothetical protein